MKIERITAMIAPVSEELAAKWICVIDGRIFHSAPDPSEAYQPISLEVEHRDNEATRLLLRIWDGVVDDPFVQFNQTPNPRCNPDIAVEAWMGWEDEALVKVFTGQLMGVRPHYPLMQTEFAALHNAIRMRKRAKVISHQGLTVLELFKKLAGEEGIAITIDKTAAGDPALNEPTSVIFQLGEPNWALMRRYVHSLGYVTNTIKENEINVKWDKSAGSVIEVHRGDLELISLDARFEQKSSKRSPKQKGHSAEQKHGQFIHHSEGADCAGGKGVMLHQPIARKRKQLRQRMPEKFSVKGVARRLEREGDELTIHFRLKPEMRNEEVIQLSGFGAKLDRSWDTAAVVHRVGSGPAVTECACWGKA